MSGANKAAPRTRIADTPSSDTENVCARVDFKHVDLLQAAASAAFTSDSVSAAAGACRCVALARTNERLKNCPFTSSAHVLFVTSGPRPNSSSEYRPLSNGADLGADQRLAAWKI